MSDTYTLPAFWTLQLNVNAAPTMCAAHDLAFHVTGRVCVPIDIRRLEEFDPLSVPTLHQLLSEINEWEEKNPGPSAEDRAKVQDWQKTSLKP